MEDKQLYIIEHVYDIDGGFGDAVEVSDIVAVVNATKKEIEEFLEKWNKPIIYYEPYAALFKHKVIAILAKTVDIKDVVPYLDEGEKSWPKSGRYLE